MLLNDPEVRAAWRDRISWDPASGVLQAAWNRDPPERRAVMAAAGGDFTRAAAIAGGVWTSLARGEVAAALREARGEAPAPQTMSMAYAEAEALVQAGAVVAGLERLAELHTGGFASATVSLARHCHRLGDHERVVTLAQTMPGHAELALVGARAALAVERLDVAERLLDPWLQGVLPAPGGLQAGAFANVAAALLAQRNDHERLGFMARALLAAADAPDDMTPAIARVAWRANLARQAWERYDPERTPWGTVGRLELALLSGNATSAGKLMQKAGALGAPARTMLALLTGAEPDHEEANRLLGKDQTVHVWRTHAHRWQPWIEAAESAAARIEVYDLASNELPDEEALPDVMVDDGMLATLVAPKPPAAYAGPGSGVWIDAPLCSGIGMGHDWPSDESESLAASVGGHALTDREGARAWVVGGEQALSSAGEGRPMVVVAPPGDPFWAGPLPERAWPRMRIVRADPARGWAGFGERVGELALEASQSR